jgi:hypothetical protein
MLGLVTSRSAVSTAAAREPVLASTSRVEPYTASARLMIEIATPDAPVRYRKSICTGRRFSTCGNGNHTAPICCHPGVRLSITRRATTRCPLAS